jgi:hypothetical protein
LRIIKIAKSGERNPIRLCDDALLYLSLIPRSAT